MNYFRIRIDKDSIISVPTRTQGLGEGTLYLFFTNDLEEQPLPVGGEMADALRGWISGEKVYPVTENGILNVYGAIIEGVTAQRALGTVNFPLVEVKGLGLTQKNHKVSEDESNMIAYINDGITHPSAVPQLDINKIARAINERKD